MPNSFSINETQFNRLFPFYILINRELRVIAAGKSISKLFEIDSNTFFSNLFAIPRPHTAVENFDILLALQNQLVILEATDSSKLLLRGQFEYLEESDELLFVGSPWFNSMDQVREKNLLISDFAYHDPLIDLLHVLKSQELTGDDLKHLINTINQQKKDLQKANKEIHDIALFPLQNPDPIIRINLKGEVIRKNPAADKFSYFEFEDNLVSSEEFFRILSDRIDIRNPRWIIEAKSNNRDYSFVCVPMINEGYVNIYGRDITMQKRDRESLKILSQIAEDNINAVIIADKEGKITWVNRSFVEMTGYSLEESIGKKPGNLLQGPETDKKTIDYLRQQIAKGEPFNTEIINYSKGGSKYWLRLQGQPIKNERGELTGFFALEENITREKESESRFREALENISDNVWEHDFKTGKTYFSKVENEFLGYRTDQLSNNQELWLSNVLEEDRHLLIENYNKYRKTEIDSHSLEYRIRHRDGSIRWVLDRGVVIQKDKEGKPQRITGTHTDITERKTAEQRLESQRKFYEDILNNMPSDIAVFNSKHEYLFVNPKGIKDSDLRKWIIGKTDEDYCLYRNKPLSIAESRSKIFNKVIESRLPSEWEEKFITPEGKEEYILRRLFPVIDHKGNVSIVIGYGLDITERKIYEEALRINEERYRGIIANMNLGLMEMNTEGKIVFANQTLLKMTGLNEDSIKGYDSYKFLTAESLIDVQQKMKSRAEGVSEAYEVQISINENKGWWFVSAAPKYSSTGEHIGSIVICLDITNQKKLESELIKSSEQAEQLAKAKEIFLANMSHEIRTPLNAIIGMIRELGKTKLSKEQLRLLHYASKSSSHLLSLLNNILDISRINSGNFQIENVPFSLSRLLVDVESIMKPMATEKKLNFKCDIVNSSIDYIGDPSRLRQVLVNIVGNAIKFTERGGVSIQTNIGILSESTDLISIEITDTGVGMEEAFLKHIFESFTQESASTHQTFGGSGLGMAISKQLINLMGGEIAVESKKGIGSTFKISIELLKHTTQTGQNIEYDEVNISLAGRRVLLVEDNEMNRVVVSQILRQYEIIQEDAYNGAEALDKLQINQYDLILMDLNMPIMDGYQCTIEFRKINNTTPIIALTANAFKAEIDRALAIGMNDYVSKPIDDIVLIKTMKRLLGGKEAFDNSGISTTSVIQSKSSVNFSYIEKIGGAGNTTFRNELIEIFLRQSSEFLKDVNTNLPVKNFDNIYLAAHKFKPQATYMGNDELHKIVVLIEAEAKQGMNSQVIDNLIEQAELLIIKMQNELTKIISNEE